MRINNHIGFESINLLNSSSILQIVFFRKFLILRFIQFHDDESLDYGIIAN